MVRIGVVTDSHVGEYLDVMPAGVLEALTGCDHIVHAGDVSRPGVLEELERIAPVTAVRGDHDRLGARTLPLATVLTLDGVRIGVTHGRRRYAIEAAVTLSYVLSFGLVNVRFGLDRALLRRTGPVDLLIYGHWHVPETRRRGATLIFNPGAVCPLGSLENGAAPRHGIGGVVDRAVRRYRTLHGPDALTPAVGMVEIDDGQVSVRRVPIRAT